MIILLLAIIGSTVYFLLRSQMAPSTQTPHATATPNLVATSRSASSTAQQQKNATSTVTGAGTAMAKAQANATATANAKNAASSAHANATATARANATATADANAKATPGVIQTAVAGNAVYQDALNNATNGDTQAAQWDSSANCVFQQDGYHIVGMGGQPFQLCHEAAKSFNDLTVQANISIQQGSSGGVLFRITGVGGYLFDVDTTGRYRISRSSNFATGGITALQDWTNNSAIKTGTQENTLQLIAKGGQLLFYANGTFLKSMNDGTFSAGTIGFAAGASSNGGMVNVVCSNLSVYGA